MKYDKAFIKAVAKGEQMAIVKMLTPEQAFELGLQVKKYEQDKK
ncbi:hypothetical protein [Fictibacillus sp. FJAT-27399]|nr:hypothetical protein [Fictibacillus sp. FJAT-27399]